MIRILRVDMQGDAVIGNLISQPSPELSSDHLVRGSDDLTEAMPGFVAAFIGAQFIA